MNDINKACSCPNGDGSLRHPCPVHPSLTDNPQSGRVRLGDQAERASFEAWAKHRVSSMARATDGEYASNFTHALWSAWRSSLAAHQPVDGLSWADYWIERGQPDVAHDFDAFSRAEAWALQRFPGTRQPVAQLTDAEIDARLNTLYRELVASGQHNGGMSGVAWDRAVYRMASTMPLPEPPKEADDGR